MVFQLVYVSAATRPLTQTELIGLLEQARASNAEHAITGTLLYRNARFLQLLEGDEDEVRHLYSLIAADPRHLDVTTVREGRRVFRQFPTWTMAFRDLRAEPLAADGYADVLEDAIDVVQDVLDDLVAGLREADRAGRPVTHASPVLRLLSA